jgi:hypothetical protein
MPHQYVLDIANGLAILSNMNVAERRERELVRTIAGASRKLDKDMEVSPLQAIDKLQKYRERFLEQWIFPSPWLVLEDCYTLPANLSVSKMLEEIENHGAPIGIVGMVWLKFSKRSGVLRVMFRKDDKSRKTIEHSAQAAEQILSDAILRKINVQKPDEEV